MPPTLFVPGSLRDPEGNMSGQAVLDPFVPIDYCEKWFKDRINKTGVHNRILILKAGTASSKSTGFVAEMYKRIVMNSPYGRRGLICTQPRILTAIKNVSQIISVPSYSYLKVGQDIGWSTQYDKMRPARFGILSATVGTLTAQMTMGSDEDIMKKYQMILIDETHERNLQTDLVILMLYNFLSRNAGDPRCPFIVFMSATFDPNVFISFFSSLDSEMSLGNNFIHVVGQSVGYDVIWPDNIPAGIKIWDLAAVRAKEIILENPEDQEDSCDILIFMPGSKEIEETEKSLRRELSSIDEVKYGRSIILPISAKEIETQSIHFKNLDKKNSEINSPEGPIKRKIVISTVIAETGLTLDQLKYVIETGFHRATSFNPNFLTDSLVTEGAPKSRITQRFGRVGRKTRGTVYPLYTKETYDSFLDQQFPEIIVSDFGDILMPVLLEQVKDGSGNFDLTREIILGDIKLLSMPPVASMNMSLEQAYKLGLIGPGSCPDSVRITKIGSVLGRLGLKLSSTRLLASGHVYEYSVYDLIGLVACLEELSSKDSKKIRFPKAYEAVFGPEKGLMIRALLSDDFADIMVLMHHLVSSFDKGIPDMEGISKELGMKSVLINSILSRRDQIMSNLLVLGYSLGKNYSSLFDTNESLVDFGNTVTKFKYCLHDSFKTNVLELRDGRYFFRGLRVTVPRFKRNEIKELLNSSGIQTDEIVYPKYLVFDSLETSTNGPSPENVAPRVATMSGFCYLDKY